jgi:hypothetical protein
MMGKKTKRLLIFAAILMALAVVVGIHQWDITVHYVAARAKVVAESEECIRLEWNEDGVPYPVLCRFFTLEYSINGRLMVAKVPAPVSRGIGRGDAVDILYRKTNPVDCLVIKKCRD